MALFPLSTSQIRRCSVASGQLFGSTVTAASCWERVARIFPAVPVSPALEAPSRMSRAGRPSAIPSRRSRASRRLRSSCPAGPCASTPATWSPQLQTWPASVTSMRLRGRLAGDQRGELGGRAGELVVEAGLDGGRFRGRRDDEVDRHSHRRRRQVEVGEDRLRQLLVRHDDGVVLQRAQPRRPPADRFDVPLFPLGVVDLDVVARAHGAVGQQVEAGEEVGQRLLQRQRDGQRADAQRGHQRRDRDPQASGAP